MALSIGFPVALLLVLHISFTVVHGEVFSALATLTKSLYSEKDVASALYEYVESEQQRLSEITR